jgi:hypothetical protein
MEKADQTKEVETIFKIRERKVWKEEILKLLGATP